MPNFVDPKILLWNPDLLWARYLEILSHWRVDSDLEKINLPIYRSPEELGKAMQVIVKNSDDDEGLKLRWEILMAFGYGAGKEWLKWAHAQTAKITEDLVDHLSHFQSLG